MLKKQILYFIFIAHLFIAWANANAQSLLYKVPIEDQMQESSLVIEGRVVENQSYLSSLDDRIYTISKVEVLRVFKGEKQSFVNVVTKGGTVGLRREQVRPSLQLKRNELGVFMLKKDTNRYESFESLDNTYYAYSDMQGFYIYDIYEDTVKNPYYSFSEIQSSFYQILQDGIGEGLVEMVGYNIEPVTRSSKSLETNTISSFEPTEIRSGIGETITITGSGFGSFTGDIQFRNADNGGFTFDSVFSSDIVSWTDSSIRVRVPSIAGTGGIRIITSEGELLESNQELTVLSSELNTEFNGFPGEAFRAKLHDSDGNGGYTWTYNETFFENKEAVDAFERSIDTWRCATSVSWLISEEQSNVRRTDTDGVNIVAFGSSGDEISFGVLAVTTTYYLGCLNGDTITSYVSEVDMIFNLDFDWNYSEDAPDIFENDFQGTATHELGHAHNLGHVIAPTNLMHFETSSGPESATRDIDEDSRIAAILSLEFSKTDGLCDNVSISDRECGDDTLGISDFEISNADSDFIILGNSTVGDTLEILINKSENIEIDFTLYGVSGRLFDQIFLNTDVSLHTIDVSYLNPGIYVIKVIVGAEIQVGKFIKS